MVRSLTAAGMEFPTCRPVHRHHHIAQPGPLEQHADGSVQRIVPFPTWASRIDVGLCTGSPIRDHRVADIDFCHEFFVMLIAHMPLNPL